MKLEKYITQLLKNHNCVIVPDFGGFVANYKSAVIDEHSKKIHPPSKSVLFNPHLTNNDGLLGNYVAQKQQVNYPDALVYISNEVDGWNKNFELGQRIEFGEIGFLYKENGAIHFEQSRDVNLLLQAFGLKSINFVRFDEHSVETKAAPIVKKEESTTAIEKDVEATPVIKETEEPVKVIEIIDETPAKKNQVTASKITSKEEKEQTTQKESTVIALDQQSTIESIPQKEQSEQDVIPLKRNVGKTVLRYAAAVVFVPILFYSYWIPMETDALETSSIQLTDFNPIHDQPKQSYAQRSEVPTFETVERPKTWDELTQNINASVYNFELTNDFYVTVSLEKEEDIPTGTTNETTVTNSQNRSEGNYHVIAGCFSVKANAEGLVNDLNSQGYSARILDKSGGLTRVSAGGYSSRDAADQGLDKLKNSGKSGWILKK